MTIVKLGDNYAFNAIWGIAKSQDARFRHIAASFRIGMDIVVSNNQPYARVAEYKFGDRMFALAMQEYRL